MHQCQAGPYWPALLPVLRWAPPVLPNVYAYVTAPGAAHAHTHRLSAQGQLKAKSGQRAGSPCMAFSGPTASLCALHIMSSRQRRSVHAVGQESTSIETRQLTPDSRQEVLAGAGNGIAASRSPKPMLAIHRVASTVRTVLCECNGTMSLHHHVALGTVARLQQHALELATSAQGNLYRATLPLRTGCGTFVQWTQCWVVKSDRSAMLSDFSTQYWFHCTIVLQPVSSTRANWSRELPWTYMSRFAHAASESGAPLQGCGVQITSLLSSLSILHVPHLLVIQDRQLLRSSKTCYSGWRAKVQAISALHLVQCDITSWEQAGRTFLSYEAVISSMGASPAGGVKTCWRPKLLMHCNDLDG